ncbi:MAG: RagB/SusD family nutrient uptake outer membrane protein [Bacteroidales bacterium]|nr:RagB/SusD family nutrient uptake outer membrane protein [Bacteroidales bacterium]
MKSDDVMATYWSSGRTSFPYYMFNHTAQSPSNGGLWGRPYYVIRNAYNIINAIDGGKVKNVDASKLNDYKGQALAIVALCHFDLLRVFGYPYAKDGGKSPGVPIVDHSIGFDENPDRSSVAECFNFIIDRLKEAIPLLNGEKNNGHFNSYAARALLSRVYLYCEKNKEAFETADALIKDIKSSSKYALATNDGYVDMFAHGNKFGSESLFEIANTDSSNPGRDGLGYLWHWWGYAALAMTSSFEEFIGQDWDDVRSNLVAWYWNSGDSSEYPILLKYPGPANYWTPSFTNNYMVIRLSEVYLIAAEAAQKGGGSSADGLAYLNEIVKRGNPAKSVLAQDYTLDRVLDECRKEFFGEGHRYFDMLRNGKTMYRSGGKHLLNTPAEVNWNYYKCVLPISRDQFVFNPNMAQNEGYARE